MKAVKFMTISQCKRIIEAGFVGEHRRDGSQVDYADYADDILAHYHEMLDSRFSEYVMNQYNSVVETVKGVFNMRSICLMVVLLVSSNLSAAVRYEKYIAGYKCPNGYYLRVSDLMCHYQPVKSPKLAKKVPFKVISRVARSKPVRLADRPLKIDCTRVFKEMNQCTH